MDMGVLQFKLPKYIARIRCQYTNTENDNTATESDSEHLKISKDMQAYGTIPKVAIDDGRERTPKEIDCAIITKFQLVFFFDQSFWLLNTCKSGSACIYDQSRGFMIVIWRSRTTISCFYTGLEIPPRP